MLAFNLVYSVFVCVSEWWVWERYTKIGIFVHLIFWICIYTYTCNIYSVSLLYTNPTHSISKSTVNASQCLICLKKERLVFWVLCVCGCKGNYFLFLCVQIVCICFFSVLCGIRGGKRSELTTHPKSQIQFTIVQILWFP